MNYLIFRTDRIGDFLISLPLIKSIKENKKDAKIYVVTSPKNNEYVKSNLYIDQVFELKSNTIINKIKLIFKLRKIVFNTVIVCDKKNRSVFLSIFLKSKKKNI